MSDGWDVGERWLLADVLERRAAEQGAKVLCWYDDTPVTYAETHRRATAAANWLHDFGIGPGEAVAAYLENCPEFTDIWFATTMTGPLFVPINTAYRGDFLVHQLRDCGARLVVTDSELAPRVAEVAAQCPDLEAVVVRPDDDGILPELELPPGIRLLSTAELGEDDGSGLRSPADVAWNRPAAVMYTSGTTGPSKGVVLTQQYLGVAANVIVGSRGRDVANDVIYGPVPLFHFSGMLSVVLAGMMAGATGVLDRRFSLSRTWDRVREHQATVVNFVGSMILMLWNLPPEPGDADLPFHTLGGAPIPPELHRAIEERYRCKVVTMYGLTEAFPLAITGFEDPAVPGAAGRPNPMFDVRVVDDDDCEVDPTAVGEIICRPLRPHVMSEGYFGRPEANAAQMKNLWFHTGDFGKFDAEGNLHFVDRKKDAVRRRGENVSSFEVERSILTHRDVADAAVYAVPSDFAEDDVMVAVVAKTENGLDVSDLMAHCVAKLPFFAVPRFIRLVEDLPRNAVGRVLKYRLRDEGVTADTWDREAAGFEVPRR